MTETETLLVLVFTIAGLIMLFTSHRWMPWLVEKLIEMKKRHPFQLREQRDWEFVGAVGAIIVVFVSSLAMLLFNRSLVETFTALQAIITSAVIWILMSGAELAGKWAGGRLYRQSLQYRRDQLERANELIRHYWQGEIMDRQELFHQLSALDITPAHMCNMYISAVLRKEMQSHGRE